jgi:hypothetical protein
MESYYVLLNRLNNRGTCQILAVSKTYNVSLVYHALKLSSETTEITISSLTNEDLGRIIHLGDIPNTITGKVLFWNYHGKFAYKEPTTTEIAPSTNIIIQINNEIADGASKEIPSVKLVHDFFVAQIRGGSSCEKVSESYCVIVPTEKLFTFTFADINQFDTDALKQDDTLLTMISPMLMTGDLNKDNRNKIHDEYLSKVCDAIGVVDSVKKAITRIVVVKNGKLMHDIVEIDSSTFCNAGSLDNLQLLVDGGGTEKCICGEMVSSIRTLISNLIIDFYPSIHVADIDIKSFKSKENNDKDIDRIFKNILR